MTDADIDLSTGLTGMDFKEVMARMRAHRAGKLSHITRRMNIIETLMTDTEHVDEVKVNMVKFDGMLDEFKSIQNEYADMMTEEEKIEDMRNWYEPKLAQIDEFCFNATKWISSVEKSEMASRKKVMEAGVEPRSLCDDKDDKVSVAKSVCSSRSSGSRRSRSSMSSTISTRICAEAERAALLAKADVLKEKHALEAELKELDQEREKFRKRKEMLEIQAEIAANTAKIEYLKDAEDLKENTAAVSDGMNAYLDEQLDQTFYKSPVVRLKDGSHVQSLTLNASQSAVGARSVDRAQDQQSPQHRLKATQVISQHSQQSHQISSSPNSLQEVDKFCGIMQRQNDLTESLVKQNILSSLPKCDIQVFDGDILKYSSFIHSIEHLIESKTTNNQDRLYFLIQYTKGQAQKLVKSCQHMTPERGYSEAKRLLKQHFGSEYKISCSYVEKALSWPALKSEDSQGLQDFALFLRSCCNVMEQMRYMEELNTISNMRNIVMKLPYKLRERWRSRACEIQEQSGRIKMNDLVCFIENQAKVLSDPLFGNIQDPNVSRIQKSKMLKPKTKGSFAVKVDVKSTQSDVQHPCLFCSDNRDNHGIETCERFEKIPHKEKIAFVKQNGICFGCLAKAGHISKDCMKRLSCNTCSKSHPSVLHIKPKDYSDQMLKAPVKSAQVSLQVGKHAGAGTIHHHTDCMLSIVPVQVKSSKGSKIIQTYAFLDPGSSATFCTENLMNKLNITGKNTNILLRTMSQDKSMPSHIIKGLEVSALDNQRFIALPEVYTQRNMPVDTNNIPTRKELSRWPYLKAIQMPRIKSQVELLIGSNTPKALEPWEIINSQGDGPYAVRTLLGWVVNGPLNVSDATDNTTTEVTVNRISVSNLEELLMQQYNHDFNEKSADEKLEMSIEDKRFIEILHKSVKLQDGHYCLNLPFRNDNPILPNNYQVAEQRLQSLKRKFKKNEFFKSEYTEFLSDVISKGYAEVIPNDELKGQDGKLWYLPHHGVYHPQKGSIRVVFDCSATFCGRSLNNELLQGPDMTSSLVGVLTRFRQEAVAVMTDIKAMFHQVKVSKTHVDFLRFLWWPEGDFSKPPAEYRMLVHLFGAVSSPSCANFALRQTAMDNRSHFRPDVISTVEKNFYVDDCLKSLPSEEEAVSLVKDLTSLCLAGGFQLTKWVSNSREVLSNIPKEDRTSEMKNLDLSKDTLPTERALGLLWCTESDMFKFNITLKNKPNTRRHILSIVSSIYDPLGFLCPFTLTAKLLLQQLCKTKQSWDEEIPQTAVSKWTKWLGDLEKLKDFKVARCVKPLGCETPKQAELHHFSDASNHGYGTVSYLRVISGQNTANVAFMVGKARVAPLKQTTIPRLELTAAVLAVRVDKMLRKELELNLRTSTFWTDSQSVLKYIANECTRFHTFVANRISIIRENTDVSQWRYIGTKQNPADKASRGVDASTLLNCTEWIHGPDFLWMKEQDWPQNSMTTIASALSLDDPEVKKTAVVYNTIITHGMSPTDQLLTYFSSWIKLKRAVVWFLKLKNILRSLCTTRKRIQSSLRMQTRSQGRVLTDEMNVIKNSFNAQSISLNDLLLAEKAIVMYCQRQVYEDEISRLRSASSIGKRMNRCSSLYKLDPVLEDGVLRVGGRLSNSSMPEEIKHPIILPKNLHISTLILQDIHERIGHGGRNHILSELRKRYWIISANSVVRKIISKCVTCRRMKGRIGEQKMSDLPAERLHADLPPFSNVGVDYFGPFETKRGRGVVKRYGVIFTCMSSRAVHLEVAYTLDTDSCINALRRFISRRGQVQHIRSDNGTNLVGAKRELQDAITAWNQNKINSAMLQKGVQWSFNPPAASHHGGVWERLIRMVRQVLFSILRQQNLEDEALQTLFCEVESILNSRPITTVSEDYQDLEALTPNHILLLKSKPLLPPGLFKKTDVYIKRRWKQVQYISDLFWKRWTKEYLLLLQERQKWTKVKPDIQKEDIVLIVDSSAPRGSWPLGRVVEVLPDAKGLVRVVKVKTKNGVLERPITKLCVLLENDVK